MRNTLEQRNLTVAARLSKVRCRVGGIADLAELGLKFSASVLPGAYGKVKKEPLVRRL